MVGRRGHRCPKNRSDAEAQGGSGEDGMRDGGGGWQKVARQEVAAEPIAIEKVSPRTFLGLAGNPKVLSKRSATRRARQYGPRKM